MPSLPDKSFNQLLVSHFALVEGVHAEFQWNRRYGRWLLAFLAGVLFISRAAGSICGSPGRLVDSCFVFFQMTIVKIVGQ